MRVKVYSHGTFLADLPMMVEGDGLMVALVITAAFRAGGLRVCVYRTK